MVHVACRDTDLSMVGRRWVEEFSNRLERYFTDILTVDWDLTMDGNEHVATCRLHTRAGFYRATARAMDARLALHEAIDKLSLQRRREKRVRGTSRRRDVRVDGFEVAFVQNGGNVVNARR